MQWTILVSVLALLVSGFFIMDRLDKFLASSHCFPDAKNTVASKAEKYDTLVFGSLDVSIDIDKMLKKEHIKYINAENINEVDRSHQYEYLFAVDKDDVENLMVCSLCEKLKPGIKKIAILNKIENKNVYEKYHIPFIYVDGITALQVVSALFPFTK